MKMLKKVNSGSYFYFFSGALGFIGQSLSLSCPGFESWESRDSGCIHTLQPPAQVLKLVRHLLSQICTNGLNPSRAKQGFICKVWNETKARTICNR